MAQSGILDSAHDCSDGGIAVTLAESGLAKGIGINVDLASVGLAARICSVWRGRQPRGDLLRPENFGRIQQMAVKYGLSAELIGETVPERVEIKLDGRVVVSAAVSELRECVRGRAGEGAADGPEAVAAD